MGNGWADWSEPRPPAQQLIVSGAQQVRFCPRCNSRTVWTIGSNSLHPELLACVCGMTVATDLTLDELDNTRRHYRLSQANTDDMVGLPAGMRT